MKKLIYILLAVVLLASCNKDEEHWIDYLKEYNWDCTEYYENNVLVDRFFTEGEWSFYENEVRMSYPDGFVNQYKITYYEDEQKISVPDMGIGTCAVEIDGKQLILRYINSYVPGYLVFKRIKK